MRCSAAMSALRSGLLWGFRRIVGIYFREVEAVGLAPAATTGGRIFAANHVNGLVDPVLVLTTADCAICPVAKSTLWKIPGLRWLLDAVDAVPIVRRKDFATKSPEANDAVFARVASHLGLGGNILIFPEGTSHNEPHLAPLKTGAGRMLAAARAAGARGLTFQAVGLEFDARDVFRSRALVVYGPVRDVDALAATSDDLPRAVTRMVEEDLSALIILGPTWDERVLVARVAELFASEAGDASLAGRNAIGREVEAAKRTLKATSEATHDAIAGDVARYYAMLAAAGERDERVARGAPRGRGTTQILGIALLPLVAAGVLLYALPYQAPRLAARALAPRGEVDVVSTYKLGTGLLVFPLWASALVVGSFVLLPPLLATFAAAVALASPFAALDALDRSASRGRRSSRGPAQPVLRSARADLLARLQRTRQDLAAPPAPPVPDPAEARAGARLV
jgi:glycerol-3-phosphate O-acyltransferase/dihydroxyacetone phosphate acyltransferase